MTHPLARRLAAGLAIRPAPHTMLRIVFVAVDRTHEERSVTHLHDASGARTHRLRAVRYLRALLRCSLGPLGLVTRLPCFVRFRGWTSIPTLTSLRVTLLPPLKGRVVQCDNPCQRQALPGPGVEIQTAAWEGRREPVHGDLRRVA